MAPSQQPTSPGVGEGPSPKRSEQHTQHALWLPIHFNLVSPEWPTVQGDPLIRNGLPSRHKEGNPSPDLQDSSRIHQTTLSFDRF